MTERPREYDERARLTMAVSMLEDQSLARILRPRMYHSSAESLEEALFLIDYVYSQLLALLADDSAPESPHFADFLSEKGFGSASVCSSKRLAGEQATFEDVVAMWKAYTRELWK